VRRSESQPGNYAITVSEGGRIASYKVTDLGLGQVGLTTGQSFRSLEFLLEFFYDKSATSPLLLNLTPTSPEFLSCAHSPVYLISDFVSSFVALGFATVTKMK
jgi:hypothetical protein